MADEAEVEEPQVAQAEPAAASQVEPAAPAAPTGPAVAGPMSFDHLVVSPQQQQALQDRLIQIKRSQMATSAGGADETIARLRRDRAQMEEAYKATALPADALQPWDAKAKTAEHTTDPIAAFGSVGSVFAMLASSFAGLPMEYALNAGASALNAVHAQDDKAYERDFTSWKENTQLALKRHDIMRQAYNDSILKMNTNLNAGRSEMELSARKFGDQQALAFLEAGMDKELNQLVEARNKSALELQSTAEKVWLDHEKIGDLKNDPGFLSGNPALKQKAIQDWQERWKPGGRAQLRYDFTKDYIDARKAEKPDYVPDDLLKWGREAVEAQEGGGSASTGSPRAQEVARRAKQYMDEEGMDRTAAFDRANKEVANSSKADSKTGAGGRAKEIERRTQQYIGEGMKEDAAYNRAAREVGMTNTLPSGNRMADDKSLLDQIQIARDTIQTQRDYLKKYSGISGAMGAVNRMGERVGNLTGVTTNTDRQDFEKNVEKLRLSAARIMTLSRGRPLASEASRINTIVAGKNWGDTGPGTDRAMEELDELYDKLQQGLDKQVGDTWQSPVPKDAPAGASSKGNVPKWKQAPLVRPAAQ